MKFAKVLLIASLLVPSVASAQTAPQPLPLLPTNFVFFAPIIASVIAIPLVLGEDNDTVTPVLLPTPPVSNPVVSTR